MIPRDHDPELDHDPDLDLETDTDDYASGSDDGSLSPDPDNGRHLESTLERLGFGPYQWRLFALCGCGWMSDNSALQCIAVILPRVQVHYGLSSKTSGILSASTMAGVSEIGQHSGDEGGWDEVGSSWGIVWTSTKLVKSQSVVRLRREK